VNAERPSAVRLAGTLAVAGLLSGLVLAAVFLATQPRIRHQQAEALKRAIFKVLPSAREFHALARDGAGLAPRQGDAGGAPGEVVYACQDEAGRFVGYAIPARGAGFQDAIDLIYGYQPGTRTIVGLEVLGSRETPGLGDKIAYDPHWRENFRALSVDPALEPVKKGAKAAPNEVDCITGATISSEAVVSILNRSNLTWLPVLPAQAPAGPAAAPAAAPAGAPKGASP
jgi:electron transport complex protein RnfG